MEYLPRTPPQEIIAKKEAGCVVGSSRYNISYCALRYYIGGVEPKNSYGVLRWGRGQSEKIGIVTDFRSLDRLFGDSVDEMLVRAAAVDVIRSVDPRPIKKSAWQLS